MDYTTGKYLEMLEAKMENVEHMLNKMLKVVCPEDEPVSKKHKLEKLDFEDDEEEEFKLPKKKLKLRRG